MDVVIFTYDAWNRPEPKTARMFHPVRQAAAPVRRPTTFSVKIPGGGNGGEVCHLRLHRVYITATGDKSSMVFLEKPLL